jgi:hypothetical protein
MTSSISFFFIHLCEGPEQLLSAVLLFQLNGYIYDWCYARVNRTKSDGREHLLAALTLPCTSYLFILASNRLDILLGADVGGDKL